ncbi:FHS family L-fucose permease-like MFS transporter [Rhizomicrobium palustre]|uniref:FHS family L-fucose permease-like MFS transporter n=1 Tax=Rhizomicrobium palustre TaxID=189966 RepID=A0A846N1N8_9PROT|nr:sugar MFS transporter [Rhizomicrobium palustre]NIK89385.1 FHS family L-fucose permease-like MFS transporter [Rhizomicrobium palustre]
MSGIAAAPKRYVIAFLLTASLVAVWGVGHRLYDGMMPLFVGVLQLSPLQRMAAESIYSFVYLIGAIPAAIYARRFGYKAAILLGMGCVAAGAFTFYPAAETKAFSLLLAAVLTTAIGWVALETAANPLFVAFGSPERGVFRLNLAQCLYPLGAIIGIFASNWITRQGIVLPQAGAHLAIAHPYIVVGGFVLIGAFLIEENEFPAVARERAPGYAAIFTEAARLLKNKLILFAILAEAASVIGMGALWSSPMRFGYILPQDCWFATHSFMASMILFALGRFAGTALMWKLRPTRVLGGFMALAVLAAVLAALSQGTAQGVAGFALSFLLSITWPTILGMALEGRGVEMKTITGLVATGGALGGLVLRPLHFLLGDTMRLNFAVVAAASLFMALFALYACRTKGNSLIKQR